ncbi:MAG: nusB [Bacteroidetes bacterium]|jgi:N utilization substance protein B|nr:nusB [Bacteroidota bacterium]
MINRRFLRVKVMQALYSYFQSGSTDLAKAEKEMFQQIEKVYELYVYLLVLLTDIHHAATLVIEDHKNKRLPTKEDLNPNTKFIDNPILVNLTQSPSLKKEVANRKVSWQNDMDMVRKLFSEIRNGEDYKTYQASGENSPKEDKKFLELMIRNHIADNQLLEFWLEEKNIYWTDDIFLVLTTVLKTIEAADDSGKVTLSALYKDPEDDKLFARTLFTKCIAYNHEAEEMISAKTQNWEIERIAFLDVLLMKMALSEVLYLPNIPIKVSLNEYIEIAKQYSTPKSKIFINGILDKAVAELKESGKIQKTGRGLLES